MPSTNFRVLRFALIGETPRHLAPSWIRGSDQGLWVAVSTRDPRNRSDSVGKP